MHLSRYRLKCVSTNPNASQCVINEPHFNKQIYIRSERQTNGSGHPNNNIFDDNARAAAIMGGGTDDEMAPSSRVGIGSA